MKRKKKFKTYPVLGDKDIDLQIAGLLISELRVEGLLIQMTLSSGQGAYMEDGQWTEAGPYDTNIKIRMEAATLEGLAKTTWQLSDWVSNKIALTLIHAPGRGGVLIEDSESFLRLPLEIIK